MVYYLIAIVVHKMYNQSILFSEVKVDVPPSIRSVNDHVEQEEGKRAELRCLAEGQPEPKISWSKQVPAEHCLDLAGTAICRHK